MFKHKGFTLIEILVSISVIAILATIMWRGLFSFRESYELNHSVGAAFGFLKDARTRTLASEGAKQYGVHFEETQIILFDGASHSPANTIGTFRMPPLVRISSINLAGSGQDVVFLRLTGGTVQFGTIGFETKRALMQKTVHVLSSGLSEVQ